MSEALAVIPSYVRTPGDLKLLEQAIATCNATEPALEVLVVDDASPAAELVEDLRDHGSHRFELHAKTENEGFSKTVNVGLARALEEGRDAVLINADIEFTAAGWLRLMERQQREDGKGPAEVVGAKLLYPTGLIQHGGIYFSRLKRSFAHRFHFGPGDLVEANEAFTCPVTGALQFIRHACLAEVGLYDEGFALSFEDVDYCLRVFQSGGACVYQPAIWAYHMESAFRGRPSRKIEDWQKRSLIYLHKKWPQAEMLKYSPPVV